MNNVEVQRETHLITSINASVSGVMTKADTECAMSALSNEGVPGDSTISMYADGQHTLRFFKKYDNTEALSGLKARLLIYLQSAIETEERSGYPASEERDLIEELESILGGI